MIKEPYVTRLLYMIAASADPKSNEHIARLNELAEMIKYPEVFRTCRSIFYTHLTIEYNRHIDCCLFNSLLSRYTIKHKASILGRIVPIEDDCFHTIEVTRIDLIADKADELVEALFI